MIYQTFAFIYDTVMDDTLYEKWLAFTKRHLPANHKRILELACGTGALALAFAKAGYEVTALDLSEEMLTLASERLAEEELRENQELAVQFVAGDMQDLSEIGTYQAITCYSDSICYMPNEQAVQQVFATVYEALEKDGFFLFDVHSLYQIETIFPEYSYHEQGEDFAFLWDSYPGETPHSIEHELTFFIKNQQEQFDRYDELHVERTYPLETYVKMLETAGFQKVETFADFTDQKPQATSRRWFFVCQK